MANEVNSLAPPVFAPQSAKLTDDRSAARSESGKQVPPSGEVQPEPETPKESEVLRAVEMLANHARNLGRELQFEIDTDSGQTLIKVIDPDTEEIVRQIPSEEAVARARSRDADDMNLLDDMV